MSEIASSVWKAASLGIAFLIATGASAAPAGDTEIKLSGQYEYRSAGMPPCIERWVARNDGTLLIWSGAEEATDRLRIDVDPDAPGEETLTLERTKSNGQPNCRGVASSAPLNVERRLVIYRNRDGQFVIARRVPVVGTKLTALEPLGVLYPNR